MSTMSNSTATSNKDSIRSRLLEGAARLLSEEGPSALSARRVATEAGASTMGLYTHFGSMSNLVNAVISEGFTRLAEQMDSVVISEDPVDDIVNLTQAYLIHARAYPHLYTVMFGSVSLGSFQSKDRESLKAGIYTLDKITATIERAMEAGRFNQDRAFLAANRWWIIVHGYVLLEMAGYMGPDVAVRKVLAPALQSLFIGLGDDKERVSASLNRILKSE